MYLFTVGVILPSVSDSDIDSFNPLIVCFTLAIESEIDVESAIDLKNATNLVSESFTVVDSVKSLCIPCTLARRSVIITSPPLVVSNTAGSNTALSNFVNSSSISTV